MTTATARRSGREVPHPPARPAPRGGAALSEEVKAPATPAAAAGTNGRLAVVGEVKPEWKLVLRASPGMARRAAIDFPQATLMKGGRTVALNVYAMRMLSGLGGDVPPPAELPLRIFADRQHGLLGFQRAEKGDEAAWLCKRVKAAKTPSWKVGLGKVFTEDEAPARRLERKVIAFGNRIFGFYYGPEAPAEEPQS